MNLTPGERLDGAPGSSYEVVGPGWTDGRHEYVRARKLYRNFRYPADALDDAPADEGLDVLIRRPAGPGSQVGFEGDSVFALPGLPGLLEPVDVIDPPAGHTSGPWLVVADPHAPRLAEALPALAGTAPVVPLLNEVRAMLDALHRAGLAAGPFGAEDFLIDPSGRWYFLATDRVRPARDPDAPRVDLREWALFAESLLGGGGDAGWPGAKGLPDDLRAEALRLADRIRQALAPVPERSRPTGPSGAAGETRGPLDAFRRWLKREAPEGLTSRPARRPVALPGVLPYHDGLAAGAGDETNPVETE